MIKAQSKDIRKKRPNKVDTGDGTAKDVDATDVVVNMMVADSAQRAKTERLIKVTSNGSGHKTRGDSVSSYAEETANRYSNCALQFDKLLQIVLAMFF